MTTIHAKFELAPITGPQSSYMADADKQGTKDTRDRNAVS
jgi:hypothetical protein